MNYERSHDRSHWTSKTVSKTEGACLHKTKTTKGQEAVKGVARNRQTRPKGRTLRAPDRGSTLPPSKSKRPRNPDRESPQCTTTDRDKLGCSSRMDRQTSIHQGDEQNHSFISHNQTGSTSGNRINQHMDSNNQSSEVSQGFPMWSELAYSGATGDGKEGASRPPVSFFPSDAIPCWIPSADQGYGGQESSFLSGGDSGGEEYMRRSESNNSSNTGKRPREGKRVGRDEFVKRACEPCRRSKIKCSNETPCAHCISRNIMHSCVPCGNPGKVSISRTSSAQSSSDMIADENPLAHVPMSEFCWCNDDLEAFVAGLTPPVHDSFVRCLAVRNAEVRLSSQSSESPSMQADAEDSSATIINSMEHDVWSGHPSIGVFQADYDTKKGVVTSVYANQRFASILGLHRKEFLSQLQTGSVRLSIPHIDLAMLMFEDFDKSKSLFSETVFRVQPGRREGVFFVKAQKQRAFDSSGRLSRVTHFWESISVSVYRSLREANTDAKLEMTQRPKGKVRKAVASSGEDITSPTVAEMAMSRDEDDAERVRLLEDYARCVCDLRAHPSAPHSSGPAQQQQQHMQQHPAQFSSYPNLSRVESISAQFDVAPRNQWLQEDQKCKINNYEVFQKHRFEAVKDKDQQQQHIMGYDSSMFQGHVFQMTHISQANPLTIQHHHQQQQHHHHQQQQHGHPGMSCTWSGQQKQNMPSLFVQQDDSHNANAEQTMMTWAPHLLTPKSNPDNDFSHFTGLFATPSTMQQAMAGSATPNHINARCLNG